MNGGAVEVELRPERTNYTSDMRNKHRSPGQVGFRPSDAQIRGIRCVLSAGQRDPGDCCPQLSGTPTTSPAKTVLN